MAGIREKFKALLNWKLALAVLGSIFCLFWLFVIYCILYLVWISWPRHGMATSISEVAGKYEYKVPVKDIPLDGEMCYTVSRGAHAVPMIVVCGIIPASKIESVMVEFPEWSPRVFDGIDFRDDDISEAMAERMGAKKTKRGWHVEEPDSDVVVPVGQYAGEYAGTAFCHYSKGNVTVEIELSSGTGCFRMLLRGIGLE